jgi:hypothetical protein
MKLTGVFVPVVSCQYSQSPRLAEQLPDMKIRMSAKTDATLQTFDFSRHHNLLICGSLGPRNSQSSLEDNLAGPMAWSSP